MTIESWYKQFLSQYNSRVIIFERKLFTRLEIRKDDSNEIESS